MRILFGLAIAVLIVFLFVEQGRPLLRLADAAYFMGARIDHLIRYRNGKPLRGTPDLDNLEARLQQQGIEPGAPVFVRIFKKESLLELWIERQGRFVLFASYPICRWSGALGPKIRQGDRQSPEGFYTVARGQLNPNSRWHLSFNLGYPNAFDKAHQRTGDFLMVHGGCGSIGCYAVTNPVIDEIWNLINAAYDAGQPRFHVHVFPFRPTAWNRKLHEGAHWQAFWGDLEKGYEQFETARIPPLVSVCEGRYVVKPAASLRSSHAKVETNCPAVATR
jgi:murein L,D-transpeptidase YafK